MHGRLQRLRRLGMRVSCSWWEGSTKQTEACLRTQGVSRSRQEATFRAGFLNVPSCFSSLMFVLLVMNCLLFRDPNISPKKELHKSLLGLQGSLRLDIRQTVS